MLSSFNEISNDNNLVTLATDVCLFNLPSYSDELILMIQTYVMFAIMLPLLLQGCLLQTGS